MSLLPRLLSTGPAAVFSTVADMQRRTDRADIFSEVAHILRLLLVLSFSSIKHDLARSCFKLWLKIGDEGDKISRKKLARR